MFQSAKKVILILCLVVLNCPLLFGQVTISTGGNNAASVDHYNVYFEVMDAQTDSLITFATAYLQPAEDTVVTHFSIADDKGIVRFSKVMRGKYKLNIECFGYLPYKENIVINSSTSLGQIRMTEEQTFIDAARVTAIVSPVVFKRDTIIYNAAAFKVGGAEVLSDLIMKMPGINVDGDIVTVNGKEVKEITVGGRTFFFGDMSLALNNLPAKIVNKIKVIDKSKSDSSTSLNDEKERVMDVELKEEFSKGSFGNVGLASGVASNMPLNNNGTDTKMLAKANVLASFYNKINQFIFIANGGNDAPGKGYRSKIASSINSSALKGFDTSLSVIAGIKKDDSVSARDIEYFRPGGNSFRRTSENTSLDLTKNLQLEAEIKHTDVKKYELSFRPTFYLGNKNFYSSEQTVASISGSEGKTNSEGFDREIKTGFVSAYFKDNLGKSGRSIYFNGQYNLEKNSIDENLYIKDGIASSSSLGLQRFTSRTSHYFLSDLTYTEPISEHLSGIARIRGLYNYIDLNVDAANLEDKSINSAFSSSHTSQFVNLNEYVGLRYLLGNYRLSFYAKAMHDYQSSVFAGENARSGKWTTTFSPCFNLLSQDYSFQIDISTYSTSIPSTQTNPGIQLLNPLDAFVGNIYLKPSRSYDLLITRSSYEPQKVHYNIIFLTTLTDNPIVQANRIYDDGKRFSFCVNSPQKKARFHLYSQISKDFGHNDNWSIYLLINGTADRSVGFFSRSSGQLDLNSFNYKEWFTSEYGNIDGDVFYSGRSGFTPNGNWTANLIADAQLTYHNDLITTSLNIKPYFYGSYYTGEYKGHRKMGSLSISPLFDIEFPSSLFLEAYLEYTRYFGLNDQAPKDTWNLCAEVGIDLGMWSLSLSAEDLLNRTRSVTYFVSPEYVQSSLANHLGRRVLLTAKYHFGTASRTIERRVNTYLNKVE